MKYFKFSVIVTIVLIFIISGCDDYVTQPKLGTRELDDYFSNPESATQFVNASYEAIGTNTWWKTNFFRLMSTMATDDGWAGNTQQPRPEIYSYSGYSNVESGAARNNSFWRFNYQAITRTNIAIEKIPEVEFDNERLQERLVAEAKFLRSFYYFTLVKNYGGVPITTSFSELLEPEIYKYQRQSRDSVYKLIEKGFREAAEVLPRKSEYSPTELGRATQGAAKGYLAKAYLFQEKFEEAQQLFEEVINSGEYQLHPDFSKVWSIENENGPGSIFEIQYAFNPSFTTGGVYGITTGSRADGGWSWCTPTSNLEQAYLADDDSVRLRSTIIKHGESVYGDPGVDSFDASPADNKSGRIWRKFYIPQNQRPDPYANGNLQKNYILMRYADLLLMHAEAAYQNGDEQAARTSLEKVRDRVGLATDMSLSGTDLRDAIWKERRLELAGEQHRLFDLRRQKVNGEPRIAQIMGPNGSFVEYNTEESTDPFETTNNTEPQDSGIDFNVNIHTVWPIPAQTVQQSQGRIEQNPGY